jgi:hypothetical protein
MDFDKLIEGYVAARDKKAALKAEYEKKVEGLDQWMDKAERTILEHLNELKLESFKAASGTAYKQKQTSATVADWDATFGFIQKNSAWHMLEHRVNKTAVQEYITANKDLPPGINWTERTVVNVRKS